MLTEFIHNLAAILALADWVSRTCSPEDQRTQGVPLTLDIVLWLTFKAYEVQGVIQQQTSFNAIGLDHVLLVKIASTAVASFIFSLDRNQALSALSHAFLDGHPLRSYRHAPNAGPRKGWAAARASSQAIELVLLAKAGQPGVPRYFLPPGGDSMMRFSTANQSYLLGHLANGLLRMSSTR